MRWIKRKYKLSNRLSERRIVRKFLFIPTTLLSDSRLETRWLELVDITQRVVKTKNKGYKWKSIKFN